MRYIAPPRDPLANDRESLAPLLLHLHLRCRCPFPPRATAARRESAPLAAAGCRGAAANAFSTSRPNPESGINTSTHTLSAEGNHVRPASVMFDLVFLGTAAAV